MLKTDNIKVVLANPSQSFLSDPLKAEPLGLMYIEGALKALGVETEMVDMSFDKELPPADIYGFCASTIAYPQTIKYAKQVSPSYTILGGPHASALPKETKEFFDAVVIGPGETAIEQILKDFSNGRKGGIYKQTPKDINRIPIPPRTILKRIKYNGFTGASRSASIIMSRACPYCCSFCASNKIWGRKVQNRSINSIAEEIAYLQESYGIQYFKSVDDTFTLDKIRFKELSEALAGMDIFWLCNTRVDAITDEILDQMVRSKCTTVELGVESVDETVLKRNKKTQDLKTTKTAIAKIKSHGLKVKLYLIYGLPFEPEDIVKKTIDFITETEPDFVSLFTLVPYPGTDIWMHPQKYNVKSIVKDFSRYQHSVGGVEEELDWLPNIEYFDRSRELMREERNVLKKFTINWNRKAML